MRIFYPDMRILFSSYLNQVISSHTFVSSNRVLGAFRWLFASAQSLPSTEPLALNWTIYAYQHRTHVFPAAFNELRMPSAWMTVCLFLYCLILHLKYEWTLPQSETIRKIQKASSVFDKGFWSDGQVLSLHRKSRRNLWSVKSNHQGIVEYSTEINKNGYIWDSMSCNNFWCTPSKMAFACIIMLLILNLCPLLNLHSIPVHFYVHIYV